MTFFAVIAAVTGGAATAARAAVPDLAVTERRLANGLRVVLAPDDTLADVTVIVRYDVGSGDDPDGKEGLAHLVEHLEFQGSAHVDASEHARLLESFGGTNVNGLTSVDWTEYVETVPPAALDLALWLERDRMASAADHVTELSALHERAITAHEYRLRVFDTATGLVQTVVGDELFPAWHPYHRAHDGLGQIDDLGLRDVKAFMATWYTPANATLIVAGRFDAKATDAVIDGYFGRLPSWAPPPRPSLPASWRVGDVVLDLSAPVDRKRVTVAWATPPADQPGHEALDVAAAMLGGTDGALVEAIARAHEADAVDVEHWAGRAGSIFLVDVALSNGESVTPIGEAIEKTIANVAFATPAAVERARRRLQDGLDLRLETSFGRAERLAAWKGGPDPWQRARYRGVDVRAVADAVRRCLVPSARVAALVYPLGESTSFIPKGLRVVIESRKERAP